MQIVDSQSNKRLLKKGNKCEILDINIDSETKKIMSCNKLKNQKYNL